MWSLPDITRLNNRAASQKDTLEQAIHSGMLNGNPLVCEYDGDHSGELHHDLYYDIFSDDLRRGVSVRGEYRDLRESERGEQRIKENSSLSRNIARERDKSTRYV